MSTFSLSRLSDVNDAGRFFQSKNPDEDTDSHAHIFFTG